MRHNVLRLAEVANFVTANFLAKIQFLAKEKRESTTKLAILANRCWAFGFFSVAKFLN